MTATDPESSGDAVDETANAPAPDASDAATAPLGAPVDPLGTPAAAPTAAPSGHVGAPVDVPSLAAVPSRLDLIRDVEMGVTAELGRTRMLVRDILELAPGSVIELDRAAGSPVDVLVNGTVIARGEVVVIDEEFGIRITEVIGYEDDAATKKP